MRTIGRRLPRRHIGDCTVECAYCGLVDFASNMRKDAEGKWSCRLEGRGRTGRELDELNALKVPAKRHYTGEGGNADWSDDI